MYIIENFFSHPRDGYPTLLSTLLLFKIRGRRGEAEDIRGSIVQAANTSSNRKSSPDLSGGITNGDRANGGVEVVGLFDDVLVRLLVASAKDSGQRRTAAGEILHL